MEQEEPALPAKRHEMDERRTQKGVRHGQSHRYRQDAEEMAKRHIRRNIDLCPAKTDRCRVHQDEGSSQSLDVRTCTQQDRQRVQGSVHGKIDYAPYDGYGYEELQCSTKHRDRVDAIERSSRRGWTVHEEEERAYDTSTTAAKPPNVGQNPSRKTDPRSCWTASWLRAVR